MKNTVGEMAARLGYTWTQWLALPLSRRLELTLEDDGKTVTSESKRNLAIYDIPAGPERLAAFHALLNAK